MQNEKVPSAMQDNVTQAVDSGMDAETVATAELLWANLPTGRKWTSLRTDEVALVCHTVRRLASTTAQSELVEALEEATAALEGRVPDLDEVICCGGFDCGCRGASNRDLLVHSLNEALAAHRESQP